MSFFLILILFFGIFVLLLIPTLIISLIRTVVSMLGYLFTGKRRSHRGAGSYREEPRHDGGYSSGAHRHANNQQKRIFGNDEGEYVDFEEIKDDK